MERFDVIVIGRGMMGAACARHVSVAGQSVALVGPDEPLDRAAHVGPFGSHHDAGRITRRVSHDPVWTQLSSASIDRYAQIEAESGVPFFTASGAMMAGPLTGGMADFVQSFLKVGESISPAPEQFDAGQVAARFPFALPDGWVASYEAGGGWINPRCLRDAQATIAVARGAMLFRQHAVGVEGGTVTLADGSTITGDQVVVATGGYAATSGLLAKRPAMEVYARTVVFAQVPGPMPGMPTLIWVPDDVDDDLYLLPPIQYPDGKWYIKVGGEQDSPRLTDDAQMTAWFRSDGSAQAGEVLLRRLLRVMPELRPISTHRGACAVSFTPTSYPYIDRLDARTTLLTGGNGAGAKCSDELGRLGAVVAMGGDMPGFSAVFQG